MSTFSTFTLRIPLSIGHYKSKALTILINRDKLQEYLSLPAAEVIKYCIRINQNYDRILKKPERRRLDRTALAFYYNEMIESGLCKNRAEVAKVVGVSRAWITKVMKFIEIN